MIENALTMAVVLVFPFGLGTIPLSVGVALVAAYCCNARVRRLRI